MSDLFLDRTPPHNLEAEQAVLGAVFLDKDALLRVLEMVRPDDFYKTSHQRIFQVMMDLSEASQPVDLVTVTAELNDRKWLEEVGGVSYLSDLANSVPTAANVEYYAQIIKEKAILRRLIKTATQIVTNGYTSQDDVEEILSEAEKSILQIRDERTTDGFVHIKDVLMETYERIEKLHNTKSDLTGIPSGYRDLDRLTSGFQRSDLVIVAARPSVGKTAFALNIAQNVAVRAGETVAIFSLEMSASQLVQRMLCAEGNIDANRMRTGAFKEEDWEKLTMAIASLSKAKIYIDDTPGINVNQIRAKCRRLKAEEGLGIILIDYLQLIQGNNRESRQQEISAISRSLKAMARELDCTVIALSQLSRAVEQRQDKRPMLSDLRESGSIEQDADIVAFLYREDYYDQDTENKNIIEIIIAKQRNGPVGKVELAFLKEYNKFVNLSKHDESLAPGA
ncbi:replicative DNA helicase [Caldalkalibacillus thermarum TA2.A1]|uniref:Replicative DNA helicase n=1 Tax=Caldalkalibacillus thermarum (strain TA2.A1) TaxID=986075 RepID=F5L8F1_CALTT|nr:replicative DNA helicase [Caldalkalibacillus thermarum]EGL82384.1 replicative DNA helicase [Caldalkalibacillus thermarum TA2.A1]QZT34260.1 replicative DNA helicase [Caldalkalibacillus thermarum TA2.A1]